MSAASNNHKRTLFTTIATLLLACNIFAQQSDPLEQLRKYAGNIHQFNTIFPQEKVYLQFDNTAYFAGETIWFKAFVVKASNLQRAESTVLYVDLLSPSGVVLQQQKLKIKGGQADGCIMLTDQSTEQARSLRGILPYPSGYYEVRAYTQFMMNFSQDAIFSRVFPVYAKPDKDGDYEHRILTQGSWTEEKRPEGSKLKDINVTFYPEGGQLVSSAECRMAFKAIGNDGRNLDGVLQLSTTRGVIEARTEHDGMGCITFIPNQVKGSPQFITDQESERLTLPKARQDAYTLKTIRNGDSLKVVISRGPEAHAPLLGLTVTVRGEVYAYESVHFNHWQEISIDISMKNWPLGVCNLTLYSSQGEILATRALFHSVPEFQAPQIKVSSAGSSINPFSKIRLSFDLVDSRTGAPFKDRFCVSVRDASDYGTSFSGNILTNLLLTSDLKGCIERPEYYFESDDDEHRRALDLLMMVQGWSSYSRYDWSVMSGNEIYEEKRRLEDSLSINGWILSNKRRRRDSLLEGVNVFVTVQPSGSQQVEWARYTTADIGYFGFDTKDYYGQADLLMMVQHQMEPGIFEADRKARIKLERALTPTPRYIADAEKRISGLDRADHVNLVQLDPESSSQLIPQDGIILPEVTIKEKRRYIDYFTFHAYDIKKDVELELDMGEYPSDVLGYLLDKGYSCYLNPDQSSAQTSPAFKGDFFVDGMPVFWYVHDDDKCLYQGVFEEPWTLDTRDLEGMLVFDSPAELTEISQSVPLYIKYINSHNDTDAQTAMRMASTGRSVRYRLVDIHVKNEKDILSDKTKRNLGQRVGVLDGFTIQTVQFYHPQYPDGPVAGDVDYRRTLYWNPNLITDENGHAEIEFYNNSYSRHLNISGAGITASGTPYSLDSNF